MKKVIRILCFFLILTMCLMPIVSCKKKVAEPSGPIKATLDELPQYNLTNKKVKILSMNASIKSDTFTEKYGGEVELINAPQDQVKTRFINFCLSNEAPDLVTQCFSAAFVKKELVSPLEEYIDFSTNLWDGVRSTLDSFKYDGKYYMAVPEDGMVTGVFYNNELFEEYAQKTPLEYLNEDNWNWNTYREVAKKMTIDTDQDGKIDIWGTSIDIPWAILSTTGAGYNYFGEGGSIVNDIKSIRVSRAMNFLIELKNNDKVWGGNDESFRQNKMAMLQSGLWVGGAKFQSLIDNGSLRLVPDPKDPEADKYYYHQDTYTYTLAKAAPNPVGAAAFVCSLRYERYKYAQKAMNNELSLDEGMFKNKVLDDMVYQIRYSGKYSGIEPMYGYVTDLWGDLWYASFDGEPWATIAERDYPLIQERIEREYTLPESDEASAS